MQVVVALYSKTDKIVRPWVDAGFHAVLVDLQHEAGEHTDGPVTRIGADMLDWVPPRWLAVAWADAMGAADRAKADAKAAPVSP